MRKRVSPSLLVAIAALIVAASGTSYAAGKITGKQIARNAISSKHVKNGSLGTVDLSAAARTALKGATGATGAVGPAGADGPAGPKGDTGAPGAQGPQGVPGGVGATGPQGPSGPKGDTGSTGARGPTGPQGVQGPAGASGLMALERLTWSGNVGAGVTNTYWTTPCPSGKALVGWAFNANTDQAQFDQVDAKYVYDTAGLPNKVGVLVHNKAAGTQWLGIDTLCATEN